MTENSNAQEFNSMASHGNCAGVPPCQPAPQGVRLENKGCDGKDSSECLPQSGSQQPEQKQDYKSVSALVAVNREEQVVRRFNYQLNGYHYDGDTNKLHRDGECECKVEVKGENFTNDKKAFATDELKSYLLPELADLVVVLLPPVVDDSWKPTKPHGFPCLSVASWKSRCPCKGCSGHKGQCTEECHVGYDTVLDMCSGCVVRECPEKYMCCVKDCNNTCSRLKVDYDLYFCGYVHPQFCSYHCEMYGTYTSLPVEELEAD